MTTRTLARLRRVVLGAAGAVTGLALLLLLATVLDDRTISANQGTAVADVLSVGRTSAAISFTTPDGTTRAPELGVLYPTGLTAGSRIEVEYAVDDPALVRVAGRGATLALVPVASVLVVTWLLAGAGLVGLRRVSSSRELSSAGPAARPPSGRRSAGS